MEFERRVWIVLGGTIVLVAALGLLAATALPGGAAMTVFGDDGHGADAPRDEQAKSGLRFEEVSRDVGFRYNSSGPASIISDAGVYVGDVDDDGWPDLLAIGGTRPVLFENDGGEFTASGQLDGIDRSIRTAVFVDFDTDGDDDLVLFPFEGVPIVLENDDGTLRRADGVLDERFANPTGAAVGDYNLDGCPDLFVIQNGDWSMRLPAGHDTAEVSPVDDNGHRNLLFRGSCGSFENVTAEAGMRGSTWSLAASMADLDGDGRQDIHVANDFNHDVVYWNDGDGTFTRTILPDETNRNAMASEIEDFSGDGRPDLFVTNIELPANASGEVAFVADGRANGNNLLVNDGERQFEPAGRRCGVAEGGWGWAAVGADLDNDGDSDIFHTTLEFTGRLGHELLRVRQSGPEYSYPVLFERQPGAECSFRTVNASAAGFAVADGHGAAQLDFDRDGDVDIALAESSGPTNEGRFRLYENVGADGSAVQVRLADDASTPGTRVFVETGTERQVRYHNSRTDYFSQDERVLHFGTGNHSTVRVTVVWPDGSERVFEDVETGQRLLISRGSIEETDALIGGDSAGIVPSIRNGGLLIGVVIGVGFGTVAVGYSWYRKRGGAIVRRRE